MRFGKLENNALLIWQKKPVSSAFMFLFFLSYTKSTAQLTFLLYAVTTEWEIWTL